MKLSKLLMLMGVSIVLFTAYGPEANPNTTNGSSVAGSGNASGGSGAAPVANTPVIVVPATPTLNNATPTATAITSPSGQLSIICGVGVYFKEDLGDTPYKLSLFTEIKDKQGKPIPGTAYTTPPLSMNIGTIVSGERAVESIFDSSLDKPDGRVVISSSNLSKNTPCVISYNLVQNNIVDTDKDYGVVTSYGILVNGESDNSITFFANWSGNGQTGESQRVQAFKGEVKAPNNNKPAVPGAPSTNPCEPWPKCWGNSTPEG